MKYIILVCDGMSDRPVESLGGKTPLEVSKHPWMDFIAKKGRCGMTQTLYDDLPLDSGVANLSLLGYDVEKSYTGRAPLEAANMDVKLGENDVALRCNLVSIRDNKMFDFTAGHIKNEKSVELIKRISDSLVFEGVEFFPGVSYRNLLVLRDRFSDELVLAQPHDIVGKDIDGFLPRGKNSVGDTTANFIKDLMEKSRKILADESANMIWVWGAGKKPSLQKFQDKYGLSGALISAVDLLKGIGRMIGLDVIDVPGATGYLDTDYEGKAEATIEALREKDFVFLHIEATDEAGHEGIPEKKIQAIEDIDNRVLKKLMNEIDDDFLILVTSDHATPCDVKTHVTDKIPYAMYYPGIKPDKVERYTEEDIRKNGCLQFMEAKDLIDEMRKL